MSSSSSTIMMCMWLCPVNPCRVAMCPHTGMDFSPDAYKCMQATMSEPTERVAENDQFNVLEIQSDCCTWICWSTCMDKSCTGVAVPTGYRDESRVLIVLPVHA